MSDSTSESAANPSIQPTLAERLDLVIFDCDGVLVDSEPLCNAVMAALVTDLGWPMPTQEAVDRFMGKSLPQCEQIIGSQLRLLGLAGLPSDFLARLAERTEAALTGQLQAVAGIEAVLNWLPLPYCVASNGNLKKMNFTLGLTGLLPRFAGRMHCAGDVARPKPAPDLFLHAASMYGADPARCVVIEDSATGIQAARAAGMRALGYAAMTPAQRLIDAGADVIFNKMSDLPGLL